ncbi:MAG: hypothetical protein ACLVHV_01135 [Oscillospiraceae bacterium]
MDTGAKTPTQPPEEIPPEQNHQADGYHYGNQKHGQNYLPNAKIHPPAPFAQDLLDGFGGERIRHIQQQAVTLGQLLQQHGQGPEHSSYNDAA